MNNQHKAVDINETCFESFRAADIDPRARCGQWTQAKKGRKQFVSTVTVLLAFYEEANFHVLITLLPHENQSFA